MRRRGPPVRLQVGPAWVLAILLGLAHARPAVADEIVLLSGRRHQGHPREQGVELHLNEFGCSAPEMTLGVRRFRKIDVREVLPQPMQVHVHRLLEEFAADDVPRRADLLREAQAARLRAEAERIAEEILALDPTHAEALRAVGGAEKWAQRRRGDPALDRALAQELRRFLRLESGSDRREEAARLERSHGYAPGPDVLERMVRSQRRDRGVLADLALGMGARDLEQARYTLHVPTTYDATRPWPLLVALHGGGLMQEKGPVVRGSAQDALAHYLEIAQALGWFLLCPTAVEAPWTTSANFAWLDAVIEEVTTVWNVDLERVHLAGQGGGGDGAWAYGARRSEEFATVSVASAGKPIGASTLASRCALWVYHGDADEVVPVDPVRKMAEGLQRTKADFVYCELPREGHGLAPAARRDLQRFLGPRRRQRARSAWPRSSYEVPSSKAAREAFGDPAAGWGVGFPTGQGSEALLGVLRAGRTDAEFAARQLLAEHVAQREALAPSVQALVRDGSARTSTRMWAAWLCGRWRDVGAVAALGDTLRTAQDTLLLRYAADAVGQIASPDSAQDLRWALSDLSARHRALPGDVVAFQDFDRACRLGAAVALAAGRVGAGDEGFLAELEEHLVRHVLLDRRPIRAEAAHGENPSPSRAHLAEALATAYRLLDAEKTLYDMLREAVKRDALALEAMLRGMRRPAR